MWLDHLCSASSPSKGYHVVWADQSSMWPLTNAGRCLSHDPGRLDLKERAGVLMCACLQGSMQLTMVPLREVQGLGNGLQHSKLHSRLGVQPRPTHCCASSSNTTDSSSPGEADGESVHRRALLGALASAPALAVMVPPASAALGKKDPYEVSGCGVICIGESKSIMWLFIAEHFH